MYKFIPMHMECPSSCNIVKSKMFTMALLKATLTRSTKISLFSKKSRLLFWLFLTFLVTLLELWRIFFLVFFQRVSQAIRGLFSRIVSQFWGFFLTEVPIPNDWNLFLLFSFFFFSPFLPFSFLRSDASKVDNKFSYLGYLAEKF